MIGLVLFAGIGSYWLGWSLNLPVVPLLFLSGAALSQLLPPLPWETFSPLIGVAIALVFFEGGRGLGSRSLVHRHLVSHLVAIGPKLGWLLMAGLAHLLLGLPATLTLLLGALLMVQSPYTVRPFVQRLGGEEDMADVLCWESYVVSCVGCAWSVLMFLIIKANGEHPSLVTTLVLTLKVLGAGVLMGWLSAWVLLLILRRGWAPAFLQPCLCLSLALLNFGLAQALFSGAGLVASGLMGYRMAAHQGEAVGELGSHLQTLLVGMAGVALGLFLPLSMLTIDALPRIVFAFSLVLLVRPVLAYLGARKAGLSRSQNRLLRLVSPRGVLTLGITVHITQQLNELGHSEALKLIPSVYWCVLITTLGPWLIPTLIPRFLAAEPPSPA